VCPSELEMYRLFFFCIAVWLELYCEHTHTHTHTHWWCMLNIRKLHVLCSVSCVLCPVPCVLCPVPCVLCSVPCVLCYVSCVLYPVSCVLWPVSCVLYPVSYGLCPVSYGLCPVSCALCPMSVPVTLLSVCLHRAGNKTELFSDLSGFPLLRKRREQIQSVVGQIQDHRKDIRRTLKAPALDYTTVSGQEVPTVCVCLCVCVCVFEAEGERRVEGGVDNLIRVTAAIWCLSVCAPYRCVSVLIKSDTLCCPSSPVLLKSSSSFSSTCFSSALSFWLRWRTRCRPLFHPTGSKLAGELTHTHTHRNFYQIF